MPRNMHLRHASQPLGRELVVVGVQASDSPEVDHGATAGPGLVFAGSVADPMGMGLRRIPIAI
jgi:hypothetical protein